MIYRPSIDTRQNIRTTLAEQRREIASLLRQGADMIDVGETVTYQPDSLSQRDKAWVRNGDAEECLARLVVRLNIAQNVEIVRGTTEDELPTFVVHK